MRTCWNISISTLAVFGLFARETEGPWSVLTDFTYMARYHVKDINLVLDPTKTRCKDGCPTSAVLTTQNIVDGFNYEPGLHVAISYEPTKMSHYELGGVYVWQWDDSKTVTSDRSNLIIPFVKVPSIRDYVSVSKATGYYKSLFYTAELNYWRVFSEDRYSTLALSGVGGIRYMGLPETFSLTAYKGKNSSSYEISTKNDLIGLQIGFLLQINQVKHLHWDLMAKAGVGLNRMSVESLLKDNNNTITIQNQSKQNWQSNIFAEANAGLGYRILPCLDLHASYEMLYFCGLALAADQVNTISPNATFNMVKNGYVIVHGFEVGLTCSF